MEGFYTLITGSSSGIGRALAFECAKRGHNIILVSRPSERLENCAREIAASFTGTDVRSFAADLSQADSAEMVYKWCMENNLRVNCLINNAGTTGTAPFEVSDPAYISSIITVNMLSLALLTLYFIPELKKHKKAKIVNIGSMSGFFPVPFKGTYAASKAFVHSLSYSLEAELRDSGIEVFLIAPNGVDSNPKVTERINKHKFAGRLVSLSTADFARMAIDSVEKGKKRYIPLLANRLLFCLSRILPDRIIASILKKEFRKELGS